MKLSNIEFTAPSKLNEIGQLKFTADLLVTEADFSEDVSDNEGKDITLSSETVELMSKLKGSLIKDIVS